MIHGQQSLNYEKYIVRESEEENKRSRKWRRIFPNDNSARYKNYFEKDRALNILMRNQYILDIHVVRWINKNL